MLALGKSIYSIAALNDGTPQIRALIFNGPLIQSFLITAFNTRPITIIKPVFFFFIPRRIRVF